MSIFGNADRVASKPTPRRTKIRPATTLPSRRPAPPDDGRGPPAKPCRPCTPGSERRAWRASRTTTPQLRADLDTPPRAAVHLRRGVARPPRGRRGGGPPGPTNLALTTPGVCPRISSSPAPAPSNRCYEPVQTRRAVNAATFDVAGSVIAIAQWQRHVPVQLECFEMLDIVNNDH